MNAKYAVLFEGNNLLMQDPKTHAWKRYGFFTTRLVEADQAKRAIRTATELVWKELNDLGLAVSDVRLSVDDVVQVDSFQTEPPGKGFTFYPE